MYASLVGVAPAHGKHVLQMHARLSEVLDESCISERLFLPHPVRLIIASGC